MIVFAASDEHKVLARNPLGEGSHSTPAVDGGRLYIRTFTKLMCVGAR
jgi:outer membrane protein assembly factor BamB